MAFCKGFHAYDVMSGTQFAIMAHFLSGCLWIILIENCVEMLFRFIHIKQNGRDERSAVLPVCNKIYSLSWQN